MASNLAEKGAYGVKDVVAEADRLFNEGIPSGEFQRRILFAKDSALNRACPTLDQRNRFYMTEDYSKIRQQYSELLERDRAAPKKTKRSNRKTLTPRIPWDVYDKLKRELAGLRETGFDISGNQLWTALLNQPLVDPQSHFGDVANNAADSDATTGG